MEDKVIIWHNPRCRKSREGLAYLQENLKVEPEVFEYLKVQPTTEDIKAILKALKVEPEALVRKNEPDYKEHFKGKELTELLRLKLKTFSAAAIAAEGSNSPIKKRSIGLLTISCC